MTRIPHNPHAHTQALNTVNRALMSIWAAVLADETLTLQENVYIREQIDAAQEIVTNAAYPTEKRMAR